MRTGTPARGGVRLSGELEVWLRFPGPPKAGRTGIGGTRRAEMGGAGREAIGGTYQWAGPARGDWRDAARRGECADGRGQLGC